MIDRRATEGALTSHVPWLTAATTQPVKGTVFKAVTKRTADGTGLGLALIPEANIKAGHPSRRRKIFGQGDLNQTRTGRDLGQTRVGLHHTRVDHAKGTQVDFEAVIENLNR